MKRRFDERGQGGPLELAGIALIGVVFTAAIIGWAIGPDLAANSRAWQEERKQAVGFDDRVTFPHVGPPLPAGGKAHDCTLEVAKSHGLVWTDRGWRSPSRIPEPSLTGKKAEDRGTVAAWKDQMDSYIATFAFELDRCLQPELLKPDDPSTEPSVKTTNWSGKYKVEVQSQSANCAAFGVNLSEITVSHSGTTVRLSFPQAGVNVVLDATLTSDNAFDVDKADPGADGAKYSFRLRGRFDGFNNERVLRSGYYELTYNSDTCTIGFEARAS